MLKKTVNCEDYDGNPYVKDCYFHLSEAEILEFETSINGGVTQMFDKIVKETDNTEIMKQFKRFVLMAYGEKSLDGKSFVKSEEVKKAFEYSPAYSEVMIDLLTSPEAQVAFVRGVMPKKIADDPEFQKITEELAAGQASEAPALALVEKSASEANN